MNSPVSSLHQVSTIRIHHYNGDEVKENLMRQYGHERWKCFDPDDPYVNMDNQRQLEFDQFDYLASTRYILITVEQPNREEKLVCGMRLIPTLEAYDLEQPSWNYLTLGREPIKSGGIIETGRWVGQSRKSQYGELYTG